MTNQQVDMGKWQGLFEWSMKYQDGTRGTGGGPQALDEDKRAWLEKALQEFMKDFADRMKEINSSLSSSTAADPSNSTTTLAEHEALCDELVEIVDNVDYARDLHKIGGLPTLLSLMSSPHPSLRWRAAEIAATCMANNPPVQRWFMEGKALPPLLALLSDSHPVVITKALLGLSALVRHYQPGLEAFRLAGGFEKLLALLGCATDTAVSEAGAEAGQQQQSSTEQQQQQQQRRLQRKVLALLQYMIAKHPQDGLAAAEFGAVPQLQTLLQDQNTDMRAASLAVLAELLRTPAAWQWVKQHQPGLLPCLQQQQQRSSRAVYDGCAAAGGDVCEVGDEESALLTQLLQTLQSDVAPDASAGGLADHIDVDPHQDGRERAEPQTLPLVTAQDPQRHQQQPQHAQQQGQQPIDSSAWALTAVPKMDLR